MFFVLHLSKSLNPLPEKYIIRDNAIKVLNPLEALSGGNAPLSLDLGNNLVSIIVQKCLMCRISVKKVYTSR